MGAACWAFIFLTALQLCAESLPSSVEIDAVALDEKGFIYVAGTVLSPTLQTTPGVFEPLPPANCPAAGLYCVYGYVAKLAPGDNSLLWMTYFGLLSNRVAAIVVRPNGNVLIAASTSVDPHLPLPGYQTTPGSIVVAELSADGTSLVGGTYFGGAAGDRVVAIRLDVVGNVYVAGTASSANFPTTPGAYQKQPIPNTGRCAASSSSNSEFVAKFDPELKRLIFSTLVGSDTPQEAGDLAVGADGSAYVGGTRGVASFCTSNGIVTRLKPDGSGALYTAEVSGPVSMSGRSLAVDGDGFAYFAADAWVYPNPPRGALWKIDPTGRVVSVRDIGATVSSLAIVGGEVVILGNTLVGNLATSPDSPPPCALDPVYQLSSAYSARLDATSLMFDYLGYMPAAATWLASSGQMVARDPYPTSVGWVLIPAGPPPLGTVTCVANAASYSGMARLIAPGEILSIFGNQIGPEAPALGVLDSMGNLATALSGTQVLVEGTAAPLLYAGRNQINLIVPFGVPPGDRVVFELRRFGNTAASFDALVVAQDPAFFSANGTGVGLSAALNQDGSINSRSNPAEAGSAVVLFGTGIGAMAPQPVDGSSPPVISNKPVVTYTAACERRSRRHRVHRQCSHTGRGTGAGQCAAAKSNSRGASAWHGESFCGYGQLSGIWVCRDPVDLRDRVRENAR